MFTYLPETQKRECLQFTQGNYTSSSNNHHFLLKLIFSLSLLMLIQFVLPGAGMAQTRTKKVMGSFIYNGIAYNYEFNKNDVNNYSFKISTVTSVDSTAISKGSDVPGTPSTPTTVPPASANNVPGVSANVAAATPAKPVKPTPETPGLESFDEFNRDTFITIFGTQLKKFDATKSEDVLQKKSLEVFFTIQRNLDFLDDEPVTAHLILKKNNILSFLISNTSPYYDYRLSEIKAIHRIQDVQIESEDGAIKNIIVYLVDTAKIASTRGTLEFKNAYPISISGKHDPERFSEIKLNCFSCAGIQGLNRYIKLSDLLQLDITLENDKEDYSPANSAFNINPQKPVIEMRKEKRSQIISVAAFSDFIGIDQAEPNGLIQIEAKRKVNINTNYKPFKKIDKEKDIASRYNLSKYDFIRIHSDNSSKAADDSIAYYVILRDTTKKQEKKKAILERIKALPTGARLPINDDIITIDRFKNEKFKPGYYVWMPSLEPKLLFAKLDDKNRFVILDDAQSAGGVTNPIKQFQHQLVSFGSTISILKFVYPQRKLTWNVLDIGAFWYRTRVQNIQDTATNNSIAINNGFLSATTSVVFKPDSRWSFANSIGYIKQQSFNSDYGFEHNTGLFQFGFDGTFKTNETSKIFARFRWTFSEYTLKQNFTQLQIGYSVNLFANSSSSK